MPDRTQRIVIIGAGTAGLTAAETLKRQGYTNIVILERSKRAGGKCYSLHHNNHTYELGAGIIARNNHTVVVLAKQFQVRLKRATFGNSLILNVGPRRKLSVLHQLLRYSRLVKKYPILAQPGLSAIDPELSVPFTEWAHQHHLELLAKELAHFFTGFGYAYFDTVPAAYVLKYYSWNTLRSFLFHQIYTFPDGIQTLWTTIAKQYTVHYNTTIQRITRANTITITTSTGNISCDSLIITSPLDEAVQFLDASIEEQILFSKIQYCDYRTYAVWLNHFPKTSGYLPEHYTATRPGQPVFWYQRHTDTNLYTWYVLGDWTISDKQVLKNIQQVVEQLGGTIHKVETIKHWKYFPHVTADTMRSGYFDQLESLQSQRNTYYAGELLNFSTVGLTAEYAERLVERFF